MYPGHHMTMVIPTLTCGAPWGTSTFTGCSARATFADSNVHSGIIDTGTGTKLSRVDGSAEFQCLTFNGGICSANILTGLTVATYFDEAIVSINNRNYQKLILNGTGLLFYGQSPGCLGLMNYFQLNNLTMYVAAVSVPGSSTGIDFRP